MDKLNNMHHFIEVVEHSSFTAAAVRLGLSRAQMSKSVSQLEALLGSRLLNRTTRRVSLTESGRLYYERCKQVLKDIEEIEGLTSEQSQRPSGNLRLSAPTSFAITHLQGAVNAYLNEFPDVSISLSLADRFIDVVAEGFDLVIRIAELEDSTLVARKIAPCKRVLCASPFYLSAYGVPERPEQLSNHQCLVYSNELKPDIWTLGDQEKTVQVKVNGPLCADNGDVLKAAALDGLGITLLPTFIVGEALKSGELVEVLSDYSPSEISIYAVFPSKRYLSAKVRSFIDFLGDYFGDEPKWDRLD